METTENTQIEVVSEGLFIKITKQRGTWSSYVTSNKNPSKKHHQILPTENPRKRLRKSPKRKNGGTQTSLEEPRRIIYTNHEGSYKV
jgi:hypothetical protein